MGVLPRQIMHVVRSGYVMSLYELWTDQQCIGAYRDNRKAVAFPVSASHNTMSPWSQSGYDDPVNACNSALLYMSCCNNILLFIDRSYSLHLFGPYAI